MKVLIPLSFCLFLLFPNISNGYHHYVSLKNNTITVTGTVSDEFGPLPGVSVIKENSTEGTETDDEGNFTINVEVNQVLVFYFSGYKTEKTTVKQDTTKLEIKMEGQ